MLITGRALLADEDLFARMAAFIADRNMATVLAARAVLDQGTSLIHYALTHPDEPVSPSKAVDAGVDAFVLHMPEYLAFCDRVAGRTLLHVPRLGEGPKQTPDGRPVLSPVAAAGLFREAGYSIEDSLWPTDEEDPGCCFMCFTRDAVQRPLFLPVAG